MFLGLVNSTRSPQYAYLAGDAKISGNSDVLKALGPLLKKTKTAMGDDHHQQDMHGSSFHVEFLPAEDAVVSSGNVVRYPVQCNLDGKRWTIYKRYSEFVKLDREVKEEERRRGEARRNSGETNGETVQRRSSFLTPTRRRSTKEITTGIHGTSPRARLPSRGSIFEDQKGKPFIQKRHDELEIYMNDLLLWIVNEYEKVEEEEGKSEENKGEENKCSDTASNLNVARSGNHCFSLRTSSAVRLFFDVASHVESSSSVTSSGSSSSLLSTAATTRATTSGATTTTTTATLDSMLIEDSAKRTVLLRKRLEEIETRQRHQLLSRVRFLEHAGAWATWSALWSATAYIGGIVTSRVLRFCWHSVQRTPSSTKELPSMSMMLSTLLSSTTNSKTLVISALLLSFSWIAYRSYQSSDTGSSGIKRKISILYSTAIVLGSYKYYRWYSKAYKLDDDERSLYLSDVHDVMSIFVHRCIYRWGGFWTKAGQYMSARADVTPSAYVRELSSLQDGTKSADFKIVRISVERALHEIYPEKENICIEDVFSFFDPVALASASIAQVHRATLKDDGRDVVVKLRHVGIAEIMRLDMTALLHICRLIAWFEPEFNFQPMMTEWTKASLKELDFRHESVSLMEVSRGLAGEGGDGAASPPVHLQDLIVVPRSLEPFTTDNMLVLEFSRGVSVGSPEIMERLNLVERTRVLQLITEATAHTIFTIGVFNGDPHPGNILIELPLTEEEKNDEENEENEEKGEKGENGDRRSRRSEESKPVLLDFGLSKRLDEPLRLAFCRMITAAASLNLSSLIESFEDMGWIFDESNDSTETMDIMRFFFRDTAPTEEAKKELLEFNREMVKKGRARKKEKLQAPVKAFPGDILFFVRALELLRGLCSKLQVRQSPMTIMSNSATTALRHATSVHDNRRLQHPEVPWRTEWPLRTINASLQEEITLLVASLQREGLVSAIQVCVVHNGVVVVDVAVGPTDKLTSTEGSINNDIRSDSIFNSFSCTKALVATALHLLISEGKAAYDDKVSKHWPAFGGGGKSDITIEEMMSHRAGLHSLLPENLSLHMLCDWSRMCSFFEEAKPSEGYDDGMARYHALTYGWICGRLIEILNGGVPFSEFVRTRIAVPLGLENELVVGVPEEWTRPTCDPRHSEKTRYHANRLVVLEGAGSGGDVSKDEIQNMIRRIQERTKKTKRAKQTRRTTTTVKKTTTTTTDGTTNPVPASKVKKKTKQEKMEEMMSEMLESFKGKEWMLDQRMWNARRVRSATIPAANGHFSARALAIFYSALLQDGTILSTETLQRAIKLSAKDYFAEDSEFGLGYKRHKYLDDSGHERIGFGHAGAGGSIGLAIPHAKITFGLTISLPVQNSEPRQLIFELVCKRLQVGTPLGEMSGVN